MSAPFPWQAEPWHTLTRQADAGRLGHALLLSGRPGVGKHIFATVLAQRLLCEASMRAIAPCASCRSCLLFTAGSHPDFRRLSPLEDARSIGIDQIRELGEFFALRSHYGQAKVALLAPAEAMQRAAANALLKVLEEPAGPAHLLLVSHQFERLLPTIRSRCQQIRLDKFEPAAALAWLEDPAGGGLTDPAEARALLALAHGAPLAAQDAARNQTLALATKVAEQMTAVGSGRIHAVQAAQSFTGVPVFGVVDLMLGFAHALTLARLGLDASAPDAALVASGLIRLANHLNSQQLNAFTTAAFEVKLLCQATANFRENDLLDQVWQAWMRATRSERTKIAS